MRLDTHTCLHIFETCHTYYTQSLIRANKQSLPGGSDGKTSACNAGDLSQSLGHEDPLEKEMYSNAYIWNLERW